MVLVLFNNLSKKDKNAAVERLIKGSTPSQDFFLMIILAILTATFGLLLENVAIVIGSMLIAPMLYPVLSLSLGIIMADFQLISRSFYTILKSIAFGAMVAALATLLFSSHFPEITQEIITRTYASLPNVIVAIIAGFAASFALVKPQLSETLPGIAISVALIPPIAVLGVGIAKFSWIIISGSLLLFIVNAIGIVFASMLTFSLMNFYVEKAEAKKTVVKEEKRIEREIKKVKKEIK